MLDNKIFPHNIDVLSVIYGNLLSAGWLEQRVGNRYSFTTIKLQFNNANREYITWLHNFYFERGYCSNDKLVFKKKITKKNKIYFSTELDTYAFSSFNFLYDSFLNMSYEKIDSALELKSYKNFDRGARYEVARRLKRIPKDILLTPLTLAVWFMDSGSYQNSYLRIGTDYFNENEINFLKKLLLEKYDLTAIIHSTKMLNWFVCFSKTDSVKFAQIIKPYLHPSMLYKIKNL